MGCSLCTYGDATASVSPGGVKIYGASVSANSMGCAMIVTEANVGSMESVNLMAKEQMKPEFLAKNPFHHIPVLSDGNVHIGESGPILRYVAMKYFKDAYPGSKDVKKSAMIDFALTSGQTEVYPKMAKIVYPVMGFGPAADDKAVAAAELAKVVDTWFEHFCKGTDFVSGNSPTIADYYMAPFLFAAIQPAVVEKSGYTPSARSVAYVDKFCKTVKSSSLLSDGGMSIKSFIASKAS
uniref:Glutathione S-transferase n=1 Tax=Noctiluca scintillans TaxID=2966 RepID=A0A7S1A5T2_NOCSC|mmetsp:Transcript_32181/g.86207  ORF Transcript_32181/g.86207 Transcript_32181/m.86207 type:complete len:238 (+) Transcript_32181:68-781(+)